MPEPSGSGAGLDFAQIDSLMSPTTAQGAMTPKGDTTPNTFNAKTASLHDVEQGPEAGT